MAPNIQRGNKTTPDEVTSQRFLTAYAISTVIALFVVAWRIHAGRASDDDHKLPALLLGIPIVLQSIGVWVLSSKRDKDKKISEFYWFYLFWMIVCWLACSGLFLEYCFYPANPGWLLQGLPLILIIVALTPVVTMTYAIMKPPSYLRERREEPRKEPSWRITFALSSGMKDSVSRVPHFATLFFFNMFMCVAYLFAFAFAYVDKPTAGTSSPALFLAKTFKPNPHAPNSQPSSEDNSNQPSPDTKDSVTTRASKVWPQHKFYYGSNDADLIVDNSHSPLADRNSQPANVLNGISKVVVGDQVFEKWRVLKNTQNLDRVVNEIKRYADSGKGVRVEVCGRTDPKDVPEGEQGARAQYGSNFDLAEARSERLRSMIEDKLSLLNVDQSRVRIERQSLPSAALQLNEPDIKRKEAAAGGKAPVDEQAADAALEKALVKVKEELSDKARKALDDLIKRVKANATAAKNRIQVEKAQLKAFYVLPKSDRLEKVPVPNSTAEKPWDDFVTDRTAATKAEWEEDWNIEKDTEALAGSLLSPHAENVRALVAGYSSTEKERCDLREEEEFADLISDYPSEHSGKSPADNKGEALQRICVVDLAPLATGPQFASLGLMEYLYFAVYTITATGHGDIIPTTSYTRFLSSLATITEVIFLVVFFNALISLRSSHTSIHSTTQTFPAAGGKGTINVTVPAGSEWKMPMPTDNDDVLQIDPQEITEAEKAGDPLVRYGSGEVSYSVTPNPTIDKREASLEVAGQKFTVVQHGSAFDYELIKPADFEDPFPAEGGVRVFEIIAPIGCPWHVEVVSSNGRQNWLGVENLKGRASIAVGHTKGSIKVHVDKTDTKQTRTAKLSISGMKYLPIKQVGGGLDLAVGPPTSLSRSRSTFEVRIEAPPDLSWIASWNVDWINPGQVERRGDDTILYTVDENTEGTVRPAIFTIAPDSRTGILPTIQIVRQQRD